MENPESSLPDGRQVIRSQMLYSVKLQARVSPQVCYPK